MPEPYVFSHSFILIANLGAFGLGTGLAWTSPALPFLTNCNVGGDIVFPDGQNCTLPEAFSEETGSWIGSLFPVGAMLGGFLTGLLMPMIGRKWTMIGLSLPFTIGMNLNIKHLFDKFSLVESCFQNRNWCERF